MSSNDFITTIIGASIGVILKDCIFKLWHDYRTRKATLGVIYSRYADPLSSSAVSLMWRIHEALAEPGRGRFLKLVGTPATANKYSTFGTYKKLSTLYRLAVLLGWLRACRREFSYLKIAAPDELQPIESAIDKFEASLADGPDVETRRLTELCALWGLQPPTNQNKLSSIAVDLETAIDDCMQVIGIDEIGLMTDPQKSILVDCAAKAITGTLKLQNIQPAILQESLSRAIQIIDIKEAWIYRDWQSAIGDLMLKPLEGVERRFDVIGFNEFESMCTNGTEEQKKWISRLSAVFDDIDLSKQDPYDHRPNQLKAMLYATASLIKALSTCIKSTNISQKSLELATKILETT